METKDHLALSRLIAFKNADFNKAYKRTAFEAGCISPDINLLTYINGHTYKGTISFVRSTISKLRNRLKTASDYYDLGRIIHFIADYFTFPHSPDFSGTLKQHIEYESVLHKYIEKINGIDFSDQFSTEGIVLSSRILDTAHNKYLGIRHNFQSDWQYISSVCSIITDSLTCRTSVQIKNKCSARPVLGSF